jgi:hypothetical protein
MRERSLLICLCALALLLASCGIEPIPAVSQPSPAAESPQRAEEAAAPPIAPAQAAAAPAQATSYAYRFDAAPAEPKPWNPDDWDIAIHSRDRSTWKTLEPVAAHHGADCGPPPATHTVTAYEQAVYLCRDHLMTALNASSYGVIYLTPDRMVDFSGGTATIRFDMSTLRTSGRDWVSLWITPYEDNLQLPGPEWLVPSLQGLPRNAIHVEMVSSDGGTAFRAYVIGDFVSQEIEGAWWITYDSVLEPDARRRDTFELQISATRVRFGMPEYDLQWIDSAIEPLDWDRGVVQLGHHSYNPTKEDGCGAECHPNTWHWDNIEIDSALPFTMLRADRRYVDHEEPAAVRFAQSAPAESHLRFSGYGDRIEVSVDGGASWQAAQRQAQQLDDPYAFHGYWTPIPAGTHSVLFRAGGVADAGWHIRDIAIWSPR